MDCVIYDASPGDIPEIEEIERQCFSMPWTEAQLASQLRGDRHEFLTAKAPDGTVCGYVGMMYVLDEGYISNVAVSPVCRRQGIADMLIGELLDRAARLGLSFVTLEVRESNAPAIALYSKHGFKPVGMRKNYYEKPRENAILMTTFLKEMNRIENTCL